MGKTDDEIFFFLTVQYFILELQEYLSLYENFLRNGKLMWGYVVIAIYLVFQFAQGFLIRNTFSSPKLMTQYKTLHGKNYEFDFLNSCSGSLYFYPDFYVKCKEFEFILNIFESNWKKSEFSRNKIFYTSMKKFIASVNNPCSSTSCTFLMIKHDIINYLIRW